MSQILKPISDIGTYMSWGTYPAGGPPLYAYINQLSIGTYIYPETASFNYETGLDAIVDTPGDGDHIMRINCRYTIPGGYILTDLRVYLLSLPGAVAEMDPLPLTNDGQWHTYEYILLPSEVALLKSFSYDDLRFNFIGYGPLPFDPTSFEIAWAEFEVPDPDSSSSGSSLTSSSSSTSSSSGEFPVHGVTYYSNFRDINDINNPFMNNNVKMQFGGYWEQNCTSLDFDYMGYGLKRTLNSQGSIYCSDASKLFSMERGCISMVLSLPSSITNGVYLPLKDDATEFNEYLLWGVNVGRYETSIPSLYASLTPRGIEFTVWTSAGKHTTCDTSTNALANANILFEFAWDSNELDNYMVRTVMRINGVDVAIGNPPVANDSIIGLNFYVLNTPYSYNNFECTIKRLIIYDKTPDDFIVNWWSSSSSSSSSSSRSSLSSLSSLSSVSSSSSSTYIRSSSSSSSTAIRTSSSSSSSSTYVRSSSSSTSSSTAMRTSSSSSSYDDCLCIEGLVGGESAYNGRYVWNGQHGDGRKFYHDSSASYVEWNANWLIHTPTPIALEGNADVNNPRGHYHQILPSGTQTADASWCTDGTSLLYYGGSVPLAGDEFIVTGSTVSYGGYNAWLDSPSSATDIDCALIGSTLDGHLNTSNCPNLVTLDCGLDYLVSLNVSGCINMTDLWCDANYLTSLNVSGLNSLDYLICAGNLLTQGSVDAILAALVANGVNGGWVDLTGVGNAAPSAAGLASRATLLSAPRNWTHVLVNP